MEFDVCDVVILCVVWCMYVVLCDAKQVRSRFVVFFGDMC